MARTRNVCLTIPYPEGSRPADLVVHHALKGHRACYLCFSMETGDSGYRHLQVFVQLHSAVPYHWRLQGGKFTPSVLVFSPVHAEAMAGKRSDAIGYCAKGLRGKPTAGYREYLQDPCDGFTECGTRPRDCEGLSHLSHEQAYELYKMETKPAPCDGCGVSAQWDVTQDRWHHGHCTVLCLALKNNARNYHSWPVQP